VATTWLSVLWLAASGCSTLIDTEGKPCELSGDCFDSGQLCDHQTGSCVDPGPKVLDCLGVDDGLLCENDSTAPDFWYDVCSDNQCVSPGTCAEDASCNSPGPRYHLPPASDHPQLDMVSSNEPVVVDRVTGQMWQACVAGTSGNDCQGTPEPFAWADALLHCDQSEWAGYTDWYLPDRFELHTIVDYGKRSPAIDTAAFPDGQSGLFWTSSTCAGSTVQGPLAWAVDFINGQISRQGKGFDGYVRCTRRGP